MILKGSQRGGAKQLSIHLLKTEDNEHVEVHELRGFMSHDLHGALQEIHAVSRGTKARQPLFSLSLNPPPGEPVRVEEFEAAIDEVERKLGLHDQPRAVVFHEKEGRRHAHVVWSRIDSDEMKAINLPYFKLKLREVSRELYLDHGWRMPRGMADSRERDPRNFSRDEWEQAKRAKQDPKALKGLFQECWAMSDNGKSFAKALQLRGYTLAQGDRRGHVAVDFKGEVYAVSKWVGVKAKDVRAKLGEPDNLPTVDQAQADIAARMTDMLRGHIEKAEAKQQKQMAALVDQKSQLVERQRKERADLAEAHEKRWTRETANRATKLNRGFRGLWDRVTGKYGKQAKDNEREALQALHRDRGEKDKLVEQHLDERQEFHQMARQTGEVHREDVQQLHKDVSDYMRMSSRDHEAKQQNAIERSRDEERQPKEGTRRSKNDAGPDREP